MYQALYRKYRPVDFDSVVGQDAIIMTLKNSIINKSFSHAYMFFGPRGTGKTTISKIFARNINCSNPKDGIACRECDCCKASFSKNCVDIIEIDAASNNGVDEIRDLKSKISLVPSELKNKVYIIDEVHMLSIGAFNALLKTLEEPPEHAIFILATTDQQKVPETIISRCQCFSFKRISDLVIKDRLKFVCDEENIEIDDEVLSNIAMLSDGGLRDALGSLDKMMSFSSEKITMDIFTKLNGIVTNDDLKLFIENVMSGNIQGFLTQINNFNNNGKNLIQFMLQLLNYGRNILVDYYILNKSFEFSAESLLKLVNNINEKMFDIKKSGNTKIYIEMFFLKYVNDIFLSDNEKVVVSSTDSKDDVPILKNKSVEVVSEFKNVVDDDNITNYGYKYVEDLERIPRVINIDEIMKVRVNNTLATANKNLLKLELEKFELLKDYTFDQEIGYIVCSLLDSKLRAVSPNNIIISFEFDSNVKQNVANIDKIIEVYNKITSSNKVIAIISDNEWEQVRLEYINNLKNNIKYSILPEPDLVLEDFAKDDIIASSTAVELFGDIVEID